MSRLTRFRADPRKVRVSIRQSDVGWVARVASRDGARTISEWHKLSPVRAVVKALLAAERSGLPGIDLSMGWAYDHPQFVRCS